MKYFLKHITELTWIAGILLSVLTLCMWIPDFVQSDVSLWKIGVSLAFAVGNAVVLMYVLYQAGVTRTRVAMPIFCYLMCIGALSVLHGEWEGQLSVLALQAVLVLLLRTYRSDNAVHESFLCTIIICAASLLQPDMLIMLPVVWAGLLVQRAMNLRVMLASLIGAGVFALYLWISSSLYPDAFSVVSLRDAYLHELPRVEGLQNLIVVTVMAVVFAVISLLGFARENSRAQSLVLILLIMTLAGVVMMYFTPMYFASLMQVAAYCTAALAAYCFCSRQSVGMGVMFIVYILTFGGLFALGVLEVF